MKKIHVYANTHWDYEWYFTASESIIQLIYHMDEVMDALQSGALKTYLLDSQVSILEEYIAFMPEKTEVVKQLVQEGKLQIGPWYTQSDELIIAGESMVRNLWYGITYANKMGACLPIGYLPDSFGQSKDMPKIYNGFQIKDALFWRGVPKDICDRREFIWESKDGSHVHVYNIRDGYFYGGNLIYNDDVNQVESRLALGAVCENQLVSVGGDQRYVDFNLKERIAYYNAHTTHNFTYVESDLLTFFNALHKEDLPTVKGEFIDASVSKIHHSIYSSRYDHKQLNDQIERRLLYQLEPFMVMQMQMGIAPKVSVLESLWKKLLLNHAHDSACGCNSDVTNQSILQRLMDADQMSAMMLDYQVRKVSESLEGIVENDVVVYNTLPYTRKHSQEFEINTTYPTIQIVDEKGNEVSFDVISSEKVYAGSIRKDETTYDASLYYYQTNIRLTITLAPMCMQVLKVKEGIEKTQDTICSMLENDAYILTEKCGKLQLYVKDTKETIEDFLYIEDGGDDGDTYDYSYPKHDHIYALNFDNASIQYEGNHIPCMHIKGEWQLPKNLQDRKKNFRNETIAYELEIQLQQQLISCKLIVHNKVIEHRMRLLVRSHVNSKKSIADTAFGTVQRPHVDAHLQDWKEHGYKEEPTAIYPLLHHLSLKDEQRFVTCMLKGIKEYEIVHHDHIALTLFRSVPYLGKPDLLRRPGIASGNEFKYIPTPDSTLQKEITYSFAFVYGQTYCEHDIHKQWMNYANDYMYYQIQEVNRFVNTQKYFVTHPYQKRLKRVEAMISLDELSHATYSSIAPLDHKRFALRIYNTKHETVFENAIQTKSIQTVNETDFQQTCIKSDVSDLNQVKIGSMVEEEIKTYEIYIK